MITERREKTLMVLMVLMALMVLMVVEQADYYHVGDFSVRFINV